jgi:hypothetical protein
MCVCMSVCMWYVQDQLFDPLTDSNQIWCSDSSEPGGKHRLHTNSFSLTPQTISTKLNNSTIKTTNSIKLKQLTL